MATRKYPAHLDLNKNEIQNVKGQKLNSTPQGVEEAQYWYDTVNHTMKFYNGTEAVDMGSQGRIYSAGTGISISAGNEISVTAPTLINSATGSEAIAFGGTSSYATNYNSIAIGYYSMATGIGSIQIGGQETQVSGVSSISIGTTNVEGDYSIAIGSGPGVYADHSIQIGDGSNNDDDYSLYIGFGQDEQNEFLNYKLLDGTTGKIPNARLNLDSSPTSASANGITSGAVYTALGDYVPTSSKGQANGVASLDSNGKVPTAQLPSFVDDVIDSYIVSGSTPLSAGWLSATDGGTALTPETGKIYVVLSSGDYQNKTYRWSGSTYVEISASPAQATESAAGIAQIATQSEVNTGTNDTKFVTPLKLATYINAKKLVQTNPALTASGGQVTWTITTALAPDCIVSVRETSTGAEVYTDVTYGSGSITIKMNSSDVSAGVYTAVILG